MNETDVSPRLNTLQLFGLVLFVAGVVLCLSVVGTNGIQAFFQGYLMAYIFWWGLGLGSLAMLMIQHMTGGRWGFMARRILEASAMTLPVLAILFIPIVMGMNDLYPHWMDTAHVEGDPFLTHKAPYLNASAFTMRAILYFVIWIGLAFLLSRWSSEQDKAPDGDFSAALRMRYLSAGGMVLYVVTMTFTTVDWAMSIEPHFFSTMYPVIYMVGQGLSTLAFLIIFLNYMRGTRPLGEVATPDRVHDVAKFMFAFVILWTYVSYGQFVITWSGNLPEFTPWYIHRTESGWQTIALGLIIGHFAVPFFILLSRPLKRLLSGVWIVAAWIILMRMMDIFWLIAPDYYTSGLSFAALLSYVAGIVTIGGLWLLAFAWILRQRPLLPLNDMRNDPRVRRKHAHA